MTPEQQAAFIMAQAACAMAEIAGMQAANQIDTFHGRRPTHGREDFEAVVNHNTIGHNDVISFFQR